MTDSYGSDQFFPDQLWVVGNIEGSGEMINRDCRIE
jgi:hypothetical protein